MRRASFYEKPSEKKTREKSEAIRRARKLARKKAIRDGGDNDLTSAHPRQVAADAGGFANVCALIFYIRPEPLSPLWPALMIADEPCSRGQQPNAQQPLEVLSRRPLVLVLRGPIED
jgi:hypothetical protein